jgi:hypothetical protein
LVILDASMPTNVAEIARLEQDGNPIGLELRGDRLVAVYDQFVQLVDISDPRAPSVKALEALGSDRGVDFKIIDDALYVVYARRVVTDSICNTWTYDVFVSSFDLGASDLLVAIESKTYRVPVFAPLVTNPDFEAKFSGNYLHLLLLSAPIDNSTLMTFDLGAADGGLDRDANFDLGELRSDYFGNNNFIEAFGPVVTLASRDYDDEISGLRSALHTFRYETAGRLSEKSRVWLSEVEDVPLLWKTDTSSAFITFQSQDPKLYDIDATGKATLRGTFDNVGPIASVLPVGRNLVLATPLDHENGTTSLVLVDPEKAGTDAVIDRVDEVAANRETGIQLFSIGGDESSFFFRAHDVLQRYAISDNKLDDSGQLSANILVADEPFAENGYLYLQGETGWNIVEFEAADEAKIVQDLVLQPIADHVTRFGTGLVSVARTADNQLKIAYVAGVGDSAAPAQWHTFDLEDAFPELDFLGTTLHLVARDPFVHVFAPSWDTGSGTSMAVVSVDLSNLALPQFATAILPDGEATWTDSPATTNLGGPSFVEVGDHIVYISATISGDRKLNAAQIGETGQIRFSKSFTLDSARAYGRLQVSGHTVTTWRAEQAPGEVNRVRFYVERLVVEPDAEPRLLPSVSTPGAVLAYREADEVALALGFRLEAGTTHPESLYEPGIMLRTPIHALSLKGGRATVLETFLQSSPTPVSAALGRAEKLIALRTGTTKLASIATSLATGTEIDDLSALGSSLDAMLDDAALLRVGDDQVEWLDPTTTPATLSRFETPARAYACAQSSLVFDDSLVCAGTHQALRAFAAK